ncbi:MAG: S41 family peptidase [Terriglobales bacterium]
MSRKLTFLVLAISCLVAAYAVAGAALNREQHPDEPFVQMNVYQEVLEHVRRDYVTAPNLQRATDGALHGLLASLDADSSYLNPAEYQAFLRDRSKPRAGSVGLVVTKRMGYAAIVDVAPGSPAAHAGLTRGDFLEAVNHHSTTDLSLVAIRSLLTGRPGSAVPATAVVIHHVQPRHLELARAALAELPLQTQLYPGHVGYLHLPDLRKGRAGQVRRALARLQRRGATRFILDLRDCGSGNYAEAEKLANLFLRQGEIASLMGQTVPRKVVSAQASRFVTAAPLAVLINAGTFGPAEVTAAALLDNHRAPLIGDRTSGEGSVQQLIPLGDGSAVYLSVADYYTPDGKRIQGRGIKPSIEQVRYAGAMPAADIPFEGVTQTGPDLQLQKALSVLQGAAHTAHACPAPEPTGGRYVAASYATGVGR